MQYDRRKFISFLGKATLGMIVLPPFLSKFGNSLYAMTNELSTEQFRRLKRLAIKNLKATAKDDLVLTKHLDYHVVLRWGDKISDEDKFGFNNDFTCFIPFDKSNPKDGLLWVNHEYVNPLFVSGFNFRQYAER